MYLSTTLLISSSGKIIKTHLGIVIKILINRQFLYKQVILRYKADNTFQMRFFTSRNKDYIRLSELVPLCGGSHPTQNIHKSGFTNSAAS